MKTWRERITDVMADYGESWKDVIGMAIPFPGDLDKPFETDYGSTKGEAFTVWTEERVYFPACYDGFEWVASVPRKPDPKKPTSHIGGG